MIVKYYEINKTDLSKFNYFLIYGKNEGLKKEIINEKILKKIEGEIIKYDDNEFINNYDEILSNVLNKSLFVEKKIIIIYRVGERIFKYIEDITNHNINDVKFIFISDTLEKKSKIRKFFENENSLISIPVYEDNARDLTNIVIKFLNERKFSLSRESINLLVSRASGDRENLKIELEKIYFYSLSNNSIELENIKKLTNLAENYSVGELADSYLSKNIKNVSKILNENNYSDEDCILILRTILNKSKKLLNIIEKYNQTKDLDKTLSTIKPAIFWKDKENVKIQANSWNLKDLKNTIYKINGLESLLKTNSKSSLNILSNFIVNF